MSRKALIAANWKMYKTPAEAKAFVDAFLPMVAGHTRDEIALFPSPVLLPTVVPACKGLERCRRRAEHPLRRGGRLHRRNFGRASSMAVGGTHTLIGHSERRQYFAETDEIVNKKLHTALKHGIVPIVCIGEVLEEREVGQDRRRAQDADHRRLCRHHAGEPQRPSSSPMSRSGPSAPAKPRRPEIAADAHRIIRAEVAKLLGAEVAAAMRILYGGSVKPDNATALIGQEEIDGALVGGASLKPDSFTAIVKY